MFIVQTQTVPEKPLPDFFQYTDALIKAMCVMLLIYSLKEFQRLIKSVGTNQILQSEQLMRVHLYLFIGYLVAYLLYILNATVETFTNPYHPVRAEGDHTIYEPKDN